jgi:predicted ester cyclase
MSAVTNEALVRRAIEAIWNRGDLDVADELFAAGYVHHDGLITDLVVGPEAVKISAAWHRLAFPDLCVTVEDCTAIEDTVLFHWTARRVSIGRIVGDTIASNRTSLTGTMCSRVSDGKIVESWAKWDRLGVLRELGLAITE